MGHMIDAPRPGYCAAVRKTQWGTWVRCKRSLAEGDERYCWQHGARGGGA